MSLCWSRSPRSRPTFIEIIEMLLNDTNERFEKASFYHKYKAQLKNKCSSTSIHDELSIPLKPTSNAVNIEDDLDNNSSSDENDIHFFPLSRECFEKSENNGNCSLDNDMENDIDIDTIDEITNSVNYRNVSTDIEKKQLNNDNINHSNSKGNSVQSSDGSKGSKISSTTSNGSIANGHAVHYKTTMC